MRTAVTSVERTPGFSSPPARIHSSPWRTHAPPARASSGERLSVTHVSVMVW